MPTNLQRKSVEPVPYSKPLSWLGWVIYWTALTLSVPLKGWNALIAAPLLLIVAIFFLVSRKVGSRVKGSEAKISKLESMQEIAAAAIFISMPGFGDGNTAFVFTFYQVSTTSPFIMVSIAVCVLAIVVEMTATIMLIIARLRRSA